MEKEHYYWRNLSDENKPFVPIELPYRIGPKCGNFTIQGACSINSWSVVQNSAHSIKYLSLLSGIAIDETPPNQMFCRKRYLPKNHSDLFCLTHPRFGTAVPCAVKLPFSISAAHNRSADLYILWMQRGSMRQWNQLEDHSRHAQNLVYIRNGSSFSSKSTRGPDLVWAALCCSICFLDFARCLHSFNWKYLVSIFCRPLPLRPCKTTNITLPTRSEVQWQIQIVASGCEFSKRLLNQFSQLCDRMITPKSWSAVHPIY